MGCGPSKQVAPPEPGRRGPLRGNTVSRISELGEPPLEHTVLGPSKSEKKLEAACRSAAVSLQTKLAQSGDTDLIKLGTELKGEIENAGERVVDGVKGHINSAFIHDLRVLLELPERRGQGRPPVDRLGPLPSLELGVRRRVEGRPLGADGPAGAPAPLLGASHRGLPGGSVRCGHGFMC